VIYEDMFILQVTLPIGTEIRFRISTWSNLLA
jgi:hypothetical protein